VQCGFKDRHGTREVTGSGQHTCLHRRGRCFQRGYVQRIGAAEQVLAGCSRRIKVARRQFCLDQHSQELCRS